MAKKKKVSFELIPDEEGGKWAKVYRLAEAIISEHLPQLADADARIAFFWCWSWNSDPDGRVHLGKAWKVPDLYREVCPYDFLIALNGDIVPKFDDAKLEALIHHELCHCDVAEDKDGEPKEDECGRAVFRIRKHDTEEFREVIKAHGLWKTDLAALGQVVAKQMKLELGRASGTGSATKDKTKGKGKKKAAAS